MVNRSRRRRSDVGSSRSSSPVKAPQFFKIISSSEVRHRKLRIPRKFASKYGKDLSNLVFLKVPSGAVWQVELINSDGDFWLCNGLKEFTEYYSIRFGHFLVFRYDGNSNFHVLIFDMSASEIQYPFSATHCGQSNMNLTGNSHVPETEDIEIDDSIGIFEEEIPEKNEIEEDVWNEISDGGPRYRTRRTTASTTASNRAAVEIFDDPPTCRRKKESIPIPDFSSCDRKVFSPEIQCRGIQTNNGLKLPNLKKDVKPHCLTREIKKECSRATSILRTHRQSQISETKKSATAIGKLSALQRARAFKSENPFFTVYMQRSYVCNRCSLNIPTDFTRKYFSGKQDNVILRGSDGRTWSVKCYWGTSSGKGILSFMSFVQDNNIKVGDVCVFELIKVAELWLNVIIFRAGEKQSALPLEDMKIY